MGHLLVLSVCLAVLTASIAGSDDFPSNCPSVCSCRWQSGNKAATCSDKELKTIPENLNDDLQSLDLSKNPLYEISREAFYNVGLSNLKKLILKNCKLQTIDKRGFSSLRIMIELDLSKNSLKTIHAETFDELEKLRIINLNENMLEKLDDNLFKNLTFLQKIEMNNNHIFRISPKTFVNLPALRILTLHDNKLSFIKLETISDLKSLTSLELYNNPWKCDCNLQSFRDFLFQKNLYTAPTSCSEPPQLLKRLWSDLNSTDFACKPRILEPLQGTVVQAIGENVTLSCKVIGNPSPDVNWAQNNRIIHNELKKHGEHRYVISQSGAELTRWVNLTIKNVKYHDRGDFSCVAKNPGGIEEKTISLIVNRVSSTAGGGISASDNLLYIILLVVGAIFVVIFLGLCICCFCRRNNIKRHSKSDMHSSNGEALIEGSVIPEMEKSLITTVNPVTKPPRRYDAPASVISGGTEMSELNKTLLDNESVFAPNEDESRSVEYADQHPKSSRDTLSVTTANHNEQRTYPPDLLSFPPRGGQASPAASSASTAPDSSRLPPQIQQSPLHSPIYGTNPHIYKTLSHSRSQSPFTSPCAPVAPARLGYVTIPRRPRVPSWGSTASYMTVAATTEYVEPVYDNLGLRTTADGSSVLSLNKTGLEQQLSPVMRGRPLPSTPGSYQGAVVYAPIEEQDQAPSPAPSTPYSATLPRIGSSSMHYQVSPTENEKKHRPKLSSKEQIYDIPRFVQSEPMSLPNGQIFDTPSANDALARTGKIPPRPPPKPRKKNSNDPNGPLFEDEGEDGTEV